MKSNIILAVLDTVRARNVGIYGNVNNTTPFLDKFATSQATLYEEAKAPASRSLDSHVSIFTGHPVAEHQVVKSTDKLAAGETIFDELRQQGYTTGVFSENSWLTDVDAGLKDAFDTVEGPRNVPFPDELDPTSFVVEHGQGEYKEFLRASRKRNTSTWKALMNGAAVKLGSDYPGFLPSNRTSTPAETYIDLFLDWSDSQDGPWAACINLMDAHHPYEPKGEYDKWGSEYLWNLQEEIDDIKWEYNGGQRPWWERRALEALYDGCIRQIDSQLERLVNELEERGELDDTLLVILSDHGEGFGEPSHVRPNIRVASHSVGMHEVLLHVPLIVSYPNQTDAKKITDVATITKFPDAVRAAVNDTWSGREFVPDGPVVSTVHGLDEPVQARASRYCDDLSAFTDTANVVYKNNEVGVRKHVSWKDSEYTIIAPDAQTSYLSRVSNEGVVSEVFEDFEDAKIRERTDGFDDLDKATKDHLEDLGYA